AERMRQRVCTNKAQHGYASEHSARVFAWLGGVSKGSTTSVAIDSTHAIQCRGGDCATLSRTHATTRVYEQSAARVRERTLPACVCMARRSVEGKHHECVDRFHARHPVSRRRLCHPQPNACDNACVRTKRSTGTRANTPRLCLHGSEECRREAPRVCRSIPRTPSSVEEAIVPPSAERMRQRVCTNKAQHG